VQLPGLFPSVGLPFTVEVGWFVHFADGVIALQKLLQILQTIQTFFTLDITTVSRSLSK
jgi:hypothetical protein